MVRSSLLLGLLMQAMPRASLAARLGKHGPREAAYARCQPYFSGRVTLASLAALPHFSRRVVLLPEYLCNVVPMAFERAGWQVAGFPVNDRFEPDPASLAALAEAKGADILLLAPLYGAEGGIGWWLGAEGRTARQRLGLTLVIDLCQDASRLAHLGDPGERWAVLTSFNGKSFPGAMGAVLWTDLDPPAPPKPSMRVSVLIALWVLRRFLLPNRAGKEHGFEFSNASHFPWDFDTAGATRLQLALGLIGLERLPQWQERRRTALAEGRVSPLALPYAATAPFVIATSGDPRHHRSKRPYALVHDSTRSMYPWLEIRHNKGFDDR